MLPTIELQIQNEAPSEISSTKHNTGISDFLKNLKIEVVHIDDLGESVSTEEDEVAEENLAQQPLQKKNTPVLFHSNSQAVETELEVPSEEHDDLTSPGDFEKIEK